jgi:hypothetical protein
VTGAAVRSAAWDGLPGSLPTLHAGAGDPPHVSFGRMAPLSNDKGRGSTMNLIKFAVPVLMLLALGFALGGCPKKDKMMQNTPAQPAVQQQIG